MPASTRLTVAVETPATWATSRIVAVGDRSAMAWVDASGSIA
jgi:hypothetical protein